MQSKHRKTVTLIVTYLKKIFDIKGTGNNDAI